MTILSFSRVTKEYRGIPAIKDVDFDLKQGEIHALLGENGAGKSTLTKIIAGAVTPTRGEMYFEGKDIVFASPREALSAGIAMVFQENSLVPALTAGQNIYLGTERFYNSRRKINIAAQQLLQSLNFDVDPSSVVSTLGAAKKQMVEIARAVRQRAKIIIFDEPTASLTPEEAHHFFALMKRLKADGVTIIFICHAIEEATGHADRITVLRDGEKVLTAPAAELDRDSIIAAMVGRSLTQAVHSGHADRPPRPAGEKVLSVQNLSMGGMVKNASFSVFAGQVTGMFGLIGSGRSEMAKVIAGVFKRNTFHGGEIHLNGRSVRYRTPLRAVRDGIAYVTEDRKVDGFFANMSIGENIHIGALATKGSPVSVVSMAQMRTLSKTWIDGLQIKAINGDAKVIELSGGNQQKVVIAKSLAQAPDVIIFDEPTKGVDVGAIVEIHQFINDLADRGFCVIVISSYLPEVMQVSDRILVTRGGRVVEEFTSTEASEEKIMYAAVH